MIGDVYSERGSSWVILTDEKDKIVFVREFYRDIKTGPLERLSAYAHFAKNIADSRPAGMKLIGITETEYGWQSRNNKHIDIIDLNDYIYDMAPEEKEFVVRHEKVRNYYLKSTDGLVTRQRTFQKKWK
jgi:hypothetical protein